jgi:ABC-type transport system involved in cytochrome c biogenesis permease component
MPKPSRHLIFFFLFLNFISLSFDRLFVDLAPFSCGFALIAFLFAFLFSLPGFLDALMMYKQ